MPTQEFIDDVYAGKYDELLGIENPDVKYIGCERYERVSENNFAVTHMGKNFVDDFGKEYWINVYMEGGEMLTSLVYADEEIPEQLEDHKNGVRKLFM